MERRIKILVAVMVAALGVLAVRLPEVWRNDETGELVN